MVVDFDKLAQALGSSVSHAAEGAVAQAAFLARSAVIDALLDDPEPEAWIIHTSPKTGANSTGTAKRTRS